MNKTFFKYLILFQLCYFSGFLLQAQEICDNGVDDNNDNQVDLNDPDCVCSTPTNDQESLIPNYSFEEQNCCPEAYGQLNCADTWIQASGPTSDYYSGCGITYMEALVSMEGGNVVRTPLDKIPPSPDGSSYVGFYDGGRDGRYKEYIGGCLNGTMFKDSTYTLEFLMTAAQTNNPFTLAIYGSPNCSDLPFGLSNNIGCPTNAGPHWEKLGEVATSPSSASWDTHTITFTPSKDINTFVIGPDCVIKPEGDIDYYYVDRLVLLAANPPTVSPIEISESGQECGSSRLSAHTKGEGDYQWYKEGIAIVGATDSVYDVPEDGSGRYQVRLMENGLCNVSEPHDVNIPTTPVAEFSAPGNCMDAAIAFEDLSKVSSGNVDEWLWDFGDGNTSTEMSPSHQFTSPGEYEVKLVVNASSSCPDSVTHSVYVYSNPEYVASGENSCLGDTTNFIVAAGEGADNFNWDFGDGQASTNVSPNHYYESEGTYDVVLTVSSDSGCTADTSFQVTIGGNATADFSFESVCEGQSLNFADSSAADGSTITGWEWSFGDGAFSTEQNPEHEYDQPGKYEVELTIVTGQGCTVNRALQVEVYPKPVADFQPSTTCIGDTTRFMYKSSVDSGAQITSWLWIFGNEGNSDIQNPGFVFDSAGSFPVTLVINNDKGCVDSITKEVVVNALPVAGFNASHSGCSPLQVDLQNASQTSESNIVNWWWDLGDGTTSGEENPSHTYTEPGVYSVKLAVITEHRCIDTLIVDSAVHVYPYPEANFEPNPSQVEVSFSEVNFINYSEGEDLIKWSWSFGDGNTSTERSPVHSYEDIGTYEIMLISENKFGCLDTTYSTVKVLPEFAFYVPNVFSPNGDGKNESFIGKGIGVVKHEMWIYDRWGNEVYYTSNKRAEIVPWNGRKYNNGIAVQEDTYVYIIHTVNVFKESRKYIGHVSLIR